ncbi:MAG: hypothetical protein HYT79_07450 [Elusimicrobia bacterium]|nr:hypothetical protein [Elusimicrobiota bacterium]
MPVLLAAAILAALFVCANHARAQYDFQMGVGPGMDDPYSKKDSTGPTLPPIDPYAQALTQELTKTKATDYWSIIAISTGNPAQDLSMYMRRGFGRAEIISLLMIAEGGKQPLKELAQKRVRGARLREMATEYQLPYEKIRVDSLQLRKKLTQDIRLKKLENQNNGQLGTEPSTGTATGDKRP